VGILFELRQAETLPGEKVRITGCSQELGAWDPQGAASDGRDGPETDPLQLRTSASCYPSWSMSAPLWIHFDSKAAEGKGEEGCMSDLTTTDGGSEPTTGTSTPRAATQASPCGSSGLPTLEIEYKYVKDLGNALVGNGARYQWEDHISNRRIKVPQESGSLWLVSDAHWNLGEPAQIWRLSHADVVSRCAALDPEYLLERRKMAFTYYLTPECQPGNTPVRKPEEVPRFEIEEEFEALDSPKVSVLLAERLAAETASDELASNVICLQQDTALLKCELERSEEEALGLQEEAARLKAAAEALMCRAEACAAEQHAEVKQREQEKLQLQESNAELRREIQELSSETEELLAALGSLSPGLLKQALLQAERYQDDDSPF